MSPYEIYILFVDSINPSTGVQTTDRVIRACGGGIDEYCFLSLEDTETEEKEPEYVEYVDTALRKLIEWPTLGGIEYLISGLTIIVSFLHLPNLEGEINCIQILIPAKSFDSLDKEEQEIYREIAVQLHDILQADRTIMDWGLRSLDFSWIDEIERLKKSIFEGQYLLDVRKK